MQYAVVIEQSETGFSAFVLDVPGCVATGSTDDTPIPQPTSRVDYVEIAA
jgi:hypothetical protein